MLLTTQGCARLRTGPIIMQIPRGYQKKKFIVWKGAIYATLREKTPFLAFPEAKKGVANYARLRTGPIIMQIPRGYQKKSLLCGKARYVRSLGKKPHFWPSQRLKKVLLTTQGCARLRTGPIIMQIPRGYQKKKFIVYKGAICATLREKTPFLAFPEAKKGVVNYGRLRKAAHWPNNNANPSGLSEKKSLLCRKARDVRPLGKKPHFWSSQRLKKVLLTTQGCARLRTGPIIMQIPRGYQKKKVYCVERREMCDP